MVGIQNEHCRIEFDSESGGLRSIINLLLDDECLKGGNPGVMPFRIYTDLTKEFDVLINEKFDLVFPDPAEISRTVIQPGRCRLVDICQRTDSLTLRYRYQEVEARLRLTMEEQADTSDWSLRVTNTSDVPREFMFCFPCLDGVRLGPDATTNLATAMDQAGIVVRAWDRPGGVVGKGTEVSMQWHAIWDPVMKSALGLVFMDPDARSKRLVLKEPGICLEYFPPVTLPPGASLDLPPVRMLVYRGDWRPAARAYRAWFEHAYTCVEPPEWFRRSDGLVGRHFRKKGRRVEKRYRYMYALDSFRELPAVHLRVPVDNSEYAFYCRGSMDHMVHTDGDNIIRDDLGGAKAMREGIAGVHRLGLHSTLYIEGYIVHEGSELARSGRAERWAVMDKDGSMVGPYSKHGFYHMCPGCVEWQDYLADTAARLLRETGADGIRLDSLGHHFLPCYNPAHRHASPFGYNEWMKQLLAKVSRAALEVNPDVLLTTEGPVDWFGRWFHGALSSECPRDLPLMRLAVSPYRPYAYSACGSVWGSVSGLAGGGCGGSDLETLDGNWLCARFPVHEALVWGDVADEDPPPSDPQIVARQFEGDGYWAVVAVRPACQDPLEWPWKAGLSDQRGEYTLTVLGLAHQVDEAILCNIETLNWTPLEIKRCGDDLRLHLETNWALVILRRPDGPVVVGFDALPKLRAGESTTLHLKMLSARSSRIRAFVNAPGLNLTPREAAVPGEVAITVPPDALPGNYAVYVSGENLLGVKRFLVVE